MPALSFNARFAHLVISNKKVHTIRAERKRPIREGDRLYLYTGMRTANCEHLRNAVCTKVQDIWIHLHRAVVIDSKALLAHEIFELAARDGFVDPEEFFDFFVCVEKPTFKGQLIWWE